ncbi:TonB-dependent receptor [Croceicoccus sp. F390]|uniref:TonB-dependent receptor n=1 Tax=Croceicoccus esteveae TaxID=3075597 RepID=A0ABU2ZF53_9SPHN|nr:TonB-dependent receptor [Croceicoccus sp. F390]MDT0575225.1 TonB-dependent receptor [Croceicoccus sp. F390]
MSQMVRKMSFVLLAGSSLAGWSGAALAQDDSAATAAPFAAEEPVQNTGNVILVTANKRSENLQDVPVAISVLGQEQLEVTGFSDIRDISALAPNLSVSPGTVNPAATVVAIRGITTGGDESLTIDQSVALYIDGIYLARSAASAVFSKDVEAVEVLRGPQGTLFGRNSTGGAVSFRMRRPENDLGIDVEAGYGNQDSRSALVRLNTGNLIDDNLRLSFTYAHDQNDGYVDNLLTAGDNKDPGASNIDAGRFALEADLGNTGSVYYSFDYTDFRATPVAFQTTVASPTVQGFLNNATTTPGCDLDIVQERRDAFCLDDAVPVASKLYGHVLKFENDFGPVTVRSTTGWRSWRSDEPGTDLDGFGAVTGPQFSNETLFNGLPADLIRPIVGAGADFVSGLAVPTTTTSLFETVSERSQDQISQELEIVSNNAGRFNWVLGGFYFYETADEFSAQSIGVVLDVDQILRFNPNFGPLGPILADALSPEDRYRLLNTVALVDYKTSAESYAVYGQGEYRLGDEEQLGVTVGLRYTWDKKSIRQTKPFTNLADADYSEPTGHVTVDYRVTDDINVYAKASRGYRSGGFNIRTLQDPFEPEILMSYDVGIKTLFWNNRIRLNLAGFYSEYTDQQISQPVSNPAGGGFGVIVANAGETHYNGVEGELFIEPIDDLTFSGSFGYVDRDFVTYPLTQADGTVIDIADSVLSEVNTPNITASGAVQYQYYLSNEMFVLARIAATYEGDHYFFTTPQTSTFARDLESRARTLVDAQLRIGNIPLSGDSTAFVQFWGKNLFDKVHEERAVDFGQLGYGGFYFGRDRSYGVTVGASF